MTRKDFELIAATVRDELMGHNAVEPEMVAVKLADMLMDENPRFDYERFLKACGMEPAMAESITTAMKE